MESKYNTSQSVNVYCPTVENTVEVCLQYITNSERLLLEVPLDQYEAIVVAVRQRENAARSLTQMIRKGAFTYAQIKHMTLARNIHGLTLDEEGRINFINDAISISAVTAFAQSKWNGATRKVAIGNGIRTGLAVLGETFAEEVIASQLSNYNDVATNLSSVKTTSKKMAASIMKKTMIGFSATKKANSALVTGMMTSNEITHTVKEKMTSQKLFKNVAKTAASVAGGVVGTIIGSAVGLTIPNVSTTIVSLIGGVIGLMVGSALASKITKRVLDFFIRNDALQMLDIFNARLMLLTEEYLLNKEELEQALLDFEALHNMSKTLKEMSTANNPQQFADNLIHQELTRIIKLRMYLHVPTNEEIYEALEPLAL